MKAIDVHGHYGVYDAGDFSLSDRLMTGSIEVVRRRAQAADIRLTVVSPLLALRPYGGNVLRGNEDACQVSEQYTDVCFWAVLNPMQQETYKQVESLLSHPRCMGIKIHPVRHVYEIREQGEAVFEFAAQHQAVMLTHSGDPGSFPEDFIPFVNRYPAASLILGHLGNSSDHTFARQINAVKWAEKGNVFVDTSSAKSMISGLIEWAVSEVGAERLLFGTDTPLYFSACQKARIEYAEIAEDAKRAILFENATQLLRLDTL